ncbi:MotE family protein [Sulfitobacter sp. M13]
MFGSGMLNGKIIIGGLALTLCAKAALSFPELPMFKDSPLPTQPMMVLAAETKEETELQPVQDAPPLVANLPDLSNGCEAPEDVLISLTKERELVRLQQVELENQRAEFALARERLNIEKASLTELKTSIESLLGRVDAAQTDDLDRLIQLYTNMKPTDAARIMDDLDIETTIMILGTMKPRTAAPILAKIPAVRARAVSKIILERSQLPADQDLTGIKLR